MPGYRADADFGDDDSLFDSVERDDRDRRRAEAQQRNEVLSKQESVQEAARRAASEETHRVWKRRDLWREYEAAGVDPIEVDETGSPKTSLALLLNCGWTIHESVGCKTLVAPAKQAKELPRRPASNREMGT